MKKDLKGINLTILDIKNETVLAIKQLEDSINLTILDIKIETAPTLARLQNTY